MGDADAAFHLSNLGKPVRSDGPLAGKSVMCPACAAVSSVATAEEIVRMFHYKFTGGTRTDGVCAPVNQALGALLTSSGFEVFGAFPGT
jgi:hypothetical protein